MLLLGMIISMIFSIIYITCKSVYYHYNMSFYDYFYYYFRGIEKIKIKRIDFPINYAIRIIINIMLVIIVFFGNAIENTFSIILRTNNRKKYILSKIIVIVGYSVITNIVAMAFLKISSVIFKLFLWNDNNMNGFIFDYYKVSGTYLDIDLKQRFLLIIVVDCILLLMQIVISNYNFLVAVLITLVVHLVSIIYVNPVLFLNFYMIGRIWENEIKNVNYSLLLFVFVIVLFLLINLQCKIIKRRDII